MPPKNKIALKQAVKSLCVKNPVHFGNAVLIIHDVLVKKITNGTLGNEVYKKPMHYY